MTSIYINFRSNIVIISEPSLRYYFDHYGGMRDSIFLEISVTRFSANTLDSDMSSSVVIYLQIWGNVTTMSEVNPYLIIKRVSHWLEFRVTIYI